MASRNYDEVMERAIPISYHTWSLQTSSPAYAQNDNIGPSVQLALKFRPDNQSII